MVYYKVVLNGDEVFFRARSEAAAIKAANKFAYKHSMNMAFKGV